MTPRERKVFAILGMFLEGDRENATPLAREFMQQMTADGEEVRYEIRTALRRKGPLNKSDLRFACAGTDRVAFDRSLKTMEDAGIVERTPDGEYAHRGDLTDDLRLFLKSRVVPLVATHGGSVKLEGFDHPEVRIEMGGGCKGCAAASMTMNSVVEDMVKSEFGEEFRVVDVTDHTEGENPYYEEKDL